MVAIMVNIYNSFINRVYECMNEREQQIKMNMHNEKTKYTNDKNTVYMKILIYKRNVHVFCNKFQFSMNVLFHLIINFVCECVCVPSARFNSLRLRKHFRMRPFFVDCGIIIDILRAYTTNCMQ